MRRGRGLRSRTGAATVRGAEFLDVTGFTLSGQDTGSYGRAGCATLLCAPVLCCVLQAIYGGPGAPSDEAGDDAIALAEAEATEDA